MKSLFIRDDRGLPPGWSKWRYVTAPWVFGPVPPDSRPVQWLFLIVRSATWGSLTGLLIRRLAGMK